MDIERIHAGHPAIERLVRVGLLWSAVALGLPKLAPSASIFPSASPDYYLCQTSFSPFAPAYFYVLASGYPFLSTDPELARQGILGAEFRIEGLRSDQFLLDVQPAPGGTVEGNFFGDGGRISFPGCHPWETSSCLVRLLVVTVIPLTPLMEGTIVLQPLSAACNGETLPIPLTLCDEAASVRLCAPATGICFNTTTYCSYCPLSRPTGACTLPVATTTWSRLKALFH